MRLKVDGYVVIAAIALIIIGLKDISYGIHNYQIVMLPDGVCNPDNIVNNDFSCLGSDYIWSIYHLIAVSISLIIIFMIRLPKPILVILPILLILSIDSFITLYLAILLFWLLIFLIPFALIIVLIILVNKYVKKKRD